MYGKPFLNAFECRLQGDLVMVLGRYTMYNRIIRRFIIQMISRRAGSSLRYYLMNGTVSFKVSMVRIETYNKTGRNDFPVGKRRRNVPLAQITSVAVNTDVITLPFVFSAATMASCMWLKPEGYLQYLLIGLVVLICSFRHSLVISLTSGEEIEIGCWISEKRKALEVEDTFYRLMDCDSEGDED